MKKRIFAALCALTLIITAIPFAAGCEAKVNYTYLEDERGKYYEVSCKGIAYALNGKLEIPAYYGEGENKAPVRAIAADGFSGMEMASVSIPATVEKIGARAFSYCNFLTEVVFEEGITCETLPIGVFAYCPRLERITIPKSIKTVGALSFTDCSALEEVVISEGVTGIYAQAFENCTNLKKITLPGTLTTIGAQAFYYSGLEEVVIPKSVKDTVAEDGVNDKGETQYKTVAGIGYAAFHSCVNLKLAVVEAEVEKILAGTFGYCTALEKVYLPATVKKIEGAFYIDETFTYGHAFHNDKALKDIYFEGSAEEWSSIKLVKDSVDYNDAHYDNSAVTDANKHYNTKY